MGKKKEVTIMDYGIGNLLSVSRAIEECGAKAIITDSSQDISNADFLILPGVGNFSVAIKELRKNGFEEAILNYCLKERPLLGICLGMQMLFDSSEEQGFHKGLSIIAGSVKPIPNVNQKGLRNKIPHIGWAPIKVNFKSNFVNEQLLNKNQEGKFFYFIHSFQGYTDNPEECIATTNYNDIEITAVIRKGLIVGCQFHPEKSGINGIDFLNNFLNI